MSGNRHCAWRTTHPTGPAAFVLRRHRCLLPDTTQYTAFFPSLGHGGRCHRLSPLLVAQHGGSCHFWKPEQSACRFTLFLLSRWLLPPLFSSGISLDSVGTRFLPSAPRIISACKKALDIAGGFQIMKDQSLPIGLVMTFTAAFFSGLSVGVGCLFLRRTPFRHKAAATTPAVGGVMFRGVLIKRLQNFFFTHTGLLRSKLI